MNTTITATIGSTARTFTVRKDLDGTVVLTNSRGEDTGYIFTEFKNVGAFVVGACARRWNGADCRKVAQLALDALAA